ncbi:hypothetical protein GDO81_006752 [Engystomops pustulosus]|uniref:Sperm-associated antigen 5 n=1 Tax=Engystomops pustulosus TaxID=76066 RepID=A0AAV7D2B3_ENGPU|nr:hypothetical protein GDO81_006752 [Engystomops pustulosus]
MLSPANPPSDENQILDVQNVHRKSVGRTPLKALAGQQLSVLDPNTLEKRPSLSKASSQSALKSKESTRISTGATISIWSDTCRSDNVTGCSGTKVNPSKNLPLLGTAVSELDVPTLPKAPESVDELIQLHDNVQSPSKDDGHSELSVNYTTHRLHIKCEKKHELPELKKNPILKYETCQNATRVADKPESRNDVHEVLTHDEPIKILTQNLETTDEDSSAVNSLHIDALHIGKTEPLLPAKRNDGRLEDLVTGEDHDDGDKSYVVELANDTYDVNPIEGPEQVPLAVIDVVSTVTAIIENWDLTKTKEDCFQNVAAEGGEVHVLACPQLETLTSSLPGTLINDHYEMQILSNSPKRLDSVVSDSSGHFEDSLHTEVVLCDPEMSSCKTENDRAETRASKCCTPIDSLTTDNVLTDSTALTHNQWFSPITAMDKEGQSNPNPDQEKVTESFPLSSATPVMPNHSKGRDLSLFSREIFKNVTPRMFASPHDTGTSMTPVSTSEGVTWTTPIMLLNKSMNTSYDLLSKQEKDAKDNSSETDSLLWNFSREALRNASRDDLMDRLEGALIVVEVLSRQLQGWQQNNICPKPSEQRECATQTCVTYTSTEEQYYHNLYLQTLSRLRSVQRSQEEEQMLNLHLKAATEALTSHRNKASSMIEFATSLYETTEKDRGDLKQKMGCTRKLITDHMSVLEKMSEKLKESFHQRDEMKANMEKAIQEKEAADQCLRDLEIHSSAAIAQLRRDLESERQLCESVKEAYEQQRSYNEELADFVHGAQIVCSKVEEDRTQLQKQCSQAKGLMSLHWRLFEVMKEKTKSALDEYEGLQMERDVAVLEKEKVQGHLESMQYQNEQLTLENSRLGSELELLMGSLCTLKSDIEQLNDEKSEYEELLDAKNSSMKLLEKELNEATARGLEYQDRIKYLAGQVVPSLELDLSDALIQKENLQKQLEGLAKEHTSQVMCYKESLEFLEQENSVCREQVAETESQLKTHHLTVLERNYLCENLKDTIKDLEKKVSDLQDQLSRSQEEAQGKIMNLSKRISDSYVEVSKIKSHMLSLMETLKESMEIKTTEHSLPGSLRTSRSFLPHLDEELTTKDFNTTDPEERRESIWSKTSAFTVVLPATSQSAGTQEEHLPDVVRELSNIVSDVITVSSNAMEEKRQIVQDFKMEISSLNEELQNQRFQHASEMRVLQEEVVALKRQNCVWEEKVNCKQKCISELQEVVNKQEQKIWQQFSKAKESEALVQENAQLQLSLKVYEKEVEVLKQELAQNPTEAARSWMQEKLLLHKDLTTLRLKLCDTEYSKSEAIQRLSRHKDILKANLAHSEAEVQKLDDIIVRIRQVLLSIPEIVNNCDKLRTLMEFLN